MKKLFKKARKIRLLICDVDGVMTDGRLIYDNNGDEYKAFNSLDGHGVKMLQSTGVQVAIITGRASNIVSHRMKNLGISVVYQGQENKLAAYQEILEKLQLKEKQVAYIGDDVVDLPVMNKVGLSIAVADAHSFVKVHSDMITVKKGGCGAVRDACEFIMKAQDTYNTLMNSYL